MAHGRDYFALRYQTTPLPTPNFQYSASYREFQASFINYNQTHAKDEVIKYHYLTYINDEKAPSEYEGHDYVMGGHDMSIMLDQHRSPRMIDMLRAHARLRVPPNGRESLDLYRLIHQETAAGAPHMAQLRRCMLQFDRSLFERSESEIAAARAELVAIIDTIQAGRSQRVGAHIAVAQ